MLFAYDGNRRCCIQNLYHLWHPSQHFWTCFHSFLHDNVLLLLKWTCHTIRLHDYEERINVVLPIYAKVFIFVDMYVCVCVCVQRHKIEGMTSPFARSRKHLLYMCMYIVLRALLSPIQYVIRVIDDYRSHCWQRNGNFHNQ